ncbi:dTDP-4-dehydrorhamnose reductase [Microbulbifer sp. YPW16]|uniref:dTDP-4-dehydrorhamnose reductase n=1 Tax=Microbulbifer sp. YPW16 TaxID=2904242 RepID=UPI001E295FD4|nr:dTDP-4-dehydrorhamnose reductase [Microbulbifer sp. YPW16]UHQ55876.1 dTDP-4-dehydrorhamnose reductase [Microbulbifer sp. YPW16]
MKKALILGKNGQVAWELMRACPQGWQAQACGREEVDLQEFSSLAGQVAELEPDLLINAAAYTAVDKAESERDEAYALNQQAVANIAAIAAEQGIPLVHLSTDFVFDGSKSSPYTAADEPAPLSVYGASKLAGEQEILDRALPNALILRTSWVYSSHGQNFVKSMLRLMSDPQREHLSIVCDQVGTPTWARALARAIWAAGDMMCAGQNPGGTRILNWTDAGVASWYDFAVAIQELALERGLLEGRIPIHPIPHTDYPTPATRPAYSVLDKAGFAQEFAVQPQHWRNQLGCMLDDLAEAEAGQ